MKRGPTTESRWFGLFRLENIDLIRTVVAAAHDPWLRIEIALALKVVHPMSEVFLVFHV